MGLFRRFVSRAFWFCLMLLAIALTAGTLAGLLAERSYWCELATHFQLQYVVLLALVTIIFALDGRFKWAVFSLVVTVSAFCSHLLPLYVSPNVDTTQPRTLRLLSSNIAFFNDTQQKLIEWINEEKPDLISLYEVSPDWLETLTQLDATYPHSKIEPREKHSGIALFSRFPLEDIRIAEIGKKYPVPTMLATVLIGDQKLSYVGAHPAPPINWELTLERNDQLADLGNLVITLPTPLVLAGDFNTSSWTPAFKRLVDETGLRDSRRGFGVQNSWSTSMPLLRTTIDHCLVSPRVGVLDRRVGPDIGSDHYPIVIDMLVK